jgi:uncharacterized membrane protein YhhN
LGSLPYIIASLSLISAIFSGLFNIKDRPMARTSFKTLASVLFLATAIFSMYQAGKDTNYTIMVLTALTSGMLGDIFLSVDGLVFEKYRNYFMVIGAICFGMGHILFSAIFLSLVGSFEYYLLIIMAIIPILLFLMSKMAKINFGKFTIPVYVYSIMLSLMLITGINLFIQNGTIGALLILIAAILFTISDSCLALKEFAYKGRHKPLIYIVLITYYIAQNLFALTVMLSV